MDDGLNVKELIVTAAPLTLMPTGGLVMDVVVPPSAKDAVAVTVVAPEDSRLAEFNMTDALPSGCVSDVADVGEKVTRLPVAANVTTVFGTAVPFPSLSTAVTVTGDPKDTELDEMLRVRDPPLDDDVDDDVDDVDVVDDDESEDVVSGPVPHP